MRIPPKKPPPRKGKMVHVRYLGDWDTKGRDMDKQIRVQLKHFRLLSRIDFKRIGVIPEQIQEYNRNAGATNISLNVIC